MLDALAERRFGDLPRLWASEAETKARTASDLDVALARLREIHRDYWERDWRREHRGDGRYPETALWERSTATSSCSTPPDSRAGRGW